MAQPVTARPGAFIISLGNGAIPEVFVAPCGFTSKSLRWNRSLSAVSIPDCDNPDDPFWQSQDVESLSISISGEGVLAASAIPIWLAVINTTNSVNVEVEITYLTGVLLVTGAMQLASLEVGAQQGQRVSINASMESDGEMATTWTPV